MSTRYVVYGAGGIGAAMGAYLHLSGFEAVLIARGAHLNAIRERGLSLVSGTEPLCVPVPAVGHPSDLTWGPDDRVLLTMKAQDTEPALRDLLAAGADGDELPVVSVQNCIANEPMIARYFRRAYGAMIVIPGNFLEPGVVVNPIAGNHGYLDLGVYPRGIDPFVESLAADLTAAGYAAFPHPNVMAAKGSKFLGNLGNAMEAVTDGRGDASTYMARVRAEARACLDAAGLPYEDGDTYQSRVRTHRGTNVGMDGDRKRGSSWQSLVRRLGTIETDYLNGEVVQLGRIHGIPTPFNRVLQRIATRMAVERIPPGLYSAEELWTLAEAESARD